MTPDDWVEEYAHEFGGMVLDALTGETTGAALSLRIRGIMKKIRAKLREGYQKAQPPAPVMNGKPAGTNGTPAQYNGRTNATAGRTA